MSFLCQDIAWRILATCSANCTALHKCVLVCLLSQACGCTISTVIAVPQLGSSCTCSGYYNIIVTTAVCYIQLDGYCYFAPFHILPVIAQWSGEWASLWDISVLSFPYPEPAHQVKWMSCLCAQCPLSGPYGCSHPEAHSITVAGQTVTRATLTWYCMDRVSSRNIYAVQQDTQSVFNEWVLPANS